MNILLSAITHCSSPIGEAGRGLLFILWNPSLNFGPFRWYSLCWLIGLALAYFIVRHLFYEQGIAERTIKKNGKKEVENVFDPLIFYCFLGILIGARLGHCLFYQPDYFLSSGKHIFEMFVPIHFLADGGWKFTGYEGLASHGGTLGLIIALWLYVRYSKIGIWTVLDNIAIATGSTACLIRLGNLMNSEIIGKVTDVPWAFIFLRVDDLPRHPGSSTRPLPTPSCSSSCGLSTNEASRLASHAWERAGISDSAWPISSPSASSLNTPRTCRKPGRPTCFSTWVSCSPSPSSSSVPIVC